MIQPYCILTPNNCGSTALSQFMASSVDAYLPPFGNNEGRYDPLVLEMMRNQPWTPNVDRDYKYFYKVLQMRTRNARKQAFVEASPPNLVDYTALRKAFPKRTKYITFLASPLLQIPSEIFNYATPPLSEAVLEKRVRKYLEKMTMILDVQEISPSISHLSYEAWCAAPQRVLHAFGIQESRVQLIDDFLILGKNTLRDSESIQRTVVNLTARSLGFLREKELLSCLALLEERDQGGNLKRFAYDIEKLMAIVEKHSDVNDPNYQHGRRRRLKWEGFSARCK